MKHYTFIKKVFFLLLVFSVPVFGMNKKKLVSDLQQRFDRCSIGKKYLCAENDYDENTGSPILLAYNLETGESVSVALTKYLFSRSYYMAAGFFSCMIRPDEKIKASYTNFLFDFDTGEQWVYPDQTDLEKKSVKWCLSVEGHNFCFNKNDDDKSNVSTCSVVHMEKERETTKQMTDITSWVVRNNKLIICQKEPKKKPVITVIELVSNLLLKQAVMLGRSMNKNRKYLDCYVKTADYTRCDGERNYVNIKHPEVKDSDVNGLFMCNVGCAVQYVDKKGCLVVPKKQKKDLYHLFDVDGKEYFCNQNGCLTK